MQILMSDRHRFGRTVTRRKWFGNGPHPILNKPRSCLLESLFLDSHTPLKPFLEANFYKPVSQYIEHSRWNFDCTDLQYLTCRPISEREIFAASDSFGRFACFALLVGISDLHCENTTFVNQDNTPKFLAWDIESIFYPTKSLLDTGLLTKSIQGRPKIDGYRSHLGFDALNASSCVDGFITFWNDNQNDIGDKISFIYNSLLGAPIRIFLRDTTDYRNFYFNPKDPKNLRFVCEELQQLHQGDIPYFFFELGQQDQILFFSSPDEIQSTMRVPRPHFDMIRPLAFFQDRNRQEYLIKVGIAQIIKRFGSTQKNLLGNYFQCQLSEGVYSFESGSISFQFKI